MNSLTLVANDEHFIVDSYMGVYYLPFGDASDDSYNFHVSELNHSHYQRLYKGLAQYQQENGITFSLNYEQFLSICERLFEMYCILRKL